MYVSATLRKYDHTHLHEARFVQNPKTCILQHVILFKCLLSADSRPNVWASDGSDRRLTGSSGRRGSLFELLLHSTGLCTSPVSNGHDFCQCYCSVVSMPLCEASVCVCRSNGTLRNHWWWGTVWQMICTHAISTCAWLFYLHPASLAPFRTLTGSFFCALSCACRLMHRFLIQISKRRHLLSFHICLQM